MQQCSEAVKHKSHTGFLIEWECLQETGSENKGAVVLPL